MATNPLVVPHRSVLSRQLLLAAGLTAASGVALAATTAQQTVTYEVQAIKAITASGNPGALTISAATAGSAPTTVTDASTTYAVTTNRTGAGSTKITAELDTAMPAGVTLEVQLQAPTAASSAGYVTLTGTAADVVTNIQGLNESGKTITYRLSATSAAGVVASANKTVTLTVVDV